MATAIKRTDDIRGILARACARNEMLILVTPYLRFESFFVTLEGHELQVAATMSREDATFGLRSDDLKIRFPMALGFMEAPVKLLGLGLHDGRRTLRLAVPKQLQENDDRAEYRVERVGRVVVTYGTLRGDLLEAVLVDLSTRGARIHAQKDLADSGLQTGSVLVLSIPVAEDLRIEARGEIRHMGPRSLGLEFSPRCPTTCRSPCPGGCSGAGRRTWSAWPSGWNWPSRASAGSPRSRLGKPAESCWWAGIRTWRRPCGRSSAPSSP